MSSDLTESELEALRNVFEMARTGDLARISELVAADLPVNLTNAAGDTLLMLAAYHRHPDLVAALLEWGADPSRVNDRGQTALGAAVFRRSTASVEALLRAGADPSAGPRSALEVAAVFELPNMLALLTQARPASGSAAG